MVWGGRRLETVLGKKLPEDKLYGESWEVSDHGAHRSVVAAGPWAGRSLRELMEREREALLGAAASAHEVFPWLIKFLDAQDWLSVQVHPDKETVRRLWPGEGSKTEAWYVLEAQPESRIYAGLLPGVDERALREALAAGKVAECLYSFTPQVGDCVFLPAGTVHAVGGGVLMAEVQETSDATFRLFDWNRRDAAGNARQLHIEESLASTDWRRGPVQPIRAAGSRQSLVRFPYFELEYLGGNEALELGGSGRLRALIVVHGRGQLGGEDVVAGDVRVLPAALAEAYLVPGDGLGAILCTLPEPVRE
jgi:mannose-6-phosphate isomerase